ncbi:hypothetical protein [Nocardiopsis codii]|uniref:hypothetical protein n=1 Tax=Nocardiopsis codii TaxID=3065942 RepID=UPI002E7ACD72|nr:hypothetical protein [Nocardiopsis sp. CT-R113]
MSTSTTPLTTDEQLDMLTDGDEKISPATFPVPAPSPDYIETLAADLRTAGQSVADNGNDINSSWGALTSSYKAPEAEELHTVLGPVARDGDDVLTGLNNAANALENFAEDLRDIKRRWSSLRTEAYTFRARIDAKGDDWRDAEGVAGFFGIGESPDVAENSRLISEGTGIIEDYEAAERDCANQVNHFVLDRTNFEAMPSGGGDLDPDVFYHGYEDSLSDLAVEWDMGGATTNEHWWVDAGAAVWDFGVGAVEGTGAMLGMHSSEGWFQASWGDALWEYHEGNVQSVASLVGMYDGESDSWGWAGGDSLGSAWKDLAHSVVPWEEWGERPGYVIGTAALNIVSMVGGAALTATGVGAVVGVPLMAWRGMAIVDGMGGGRGGSGGGSGVDVDVSLPPGMPNYGGLNSPIASLDMSSFNRGDYSTAQWTELQGHIDRWSASSGGGETSDPGGRPVAPGRPAQARNDRDGQDPARPVDPTTQQLAESEAFWDIVDQPELAELGRETARDNQPRIEEVDRENKTAPGGGRGSWEANQIEPDRPRGPEAAGDRVPAGVGGRGDDTLTAERSVPASVPDRTVNLTDSTGRGSDGDRIGERDSRTGPESGNRNGDGPENRRGVPADRHGADLRDRTPTVRNSAEGDGPPKGNPSGGDRDGTRVDARTSHTDPDGRNGTDRPSSDSRTHHDAQDGGPVRPASSPDSPDTQRDGGKDDQSPPVPERSRPTGRPITPERAALQEKAYALLRGMDLGDGSDFVRKFVDVVNTHFIDSPANKRSLLREAFYEKRGHRFRADTIVNGEVIPPLIWDGSAGKWTAREALPPPAPPKYLGSAISGVRVGAPDGIRRTLDNLADMRAKAIERFKPFKEKVLRYKAAHKADPTELNTRKLTEARAERKPYFRDVTNRSEDFGEEAAKQAVRENFDGTKEIEYHEPAKDTAGNARPGDQADGSPRKKIHLPKLRESTPENPNPIDLEGLGPGNGNDQFDQIWEIDEADGGGFVVVEAKSSLKTELGDRVITDSRGTLKRVSQGTREYFDDILQEMEDRGGKEKKLARRIKESMSEDPTKNRVHYVEAKGNPQGGKYEGNSLRLFDNRKRN